MDAVRTIQIGLLQEPGYDLRTNLIESKYAHSQHCFVCRYGGAVFSSYATLWGSLKQSGPCNSDMVSEELSEVGRKAIAVYFFNILLLSLYSLFAGNNSTNFIDFIYIFTALISVLFLIWSLLELFRSFLSWYHQHLFPSSGITAKSALGRGMGFFF